MIGTDYRKSAPIRIIPRLDIKGKNVIKGVHLEGLRVVGNPAELAERYYAAGADEIVYMDAVATLYGRNNILSTVQAAAENLFVPLTVGGGIRGVGDIVSALRSGADKVAINTQAIASPDFLKEASMAFGSQCITLSVEAKRRGDGKWEALTDNGREKTGVDVIDWVRRAEDLGVGEILLTSIDREGTQTGFEIDLVRRVCQSVSIPVIASGGARTAQDCVELVEGSRCDAIALAASLHYEETTIASVKSALKHVGYAVRETEARDFEEAPV